MAVLMVWKIYYLYIIKLQDISQELLMSKSVCKTLRDIVDYDNVPIALQMFINIFEKTNGSWKRTLAYILSFSLNAAINLHYVREKNIYLNFKHGIQCYITSFSAYILIYKRFARWYTPLFKEFKRRNYWSKYKIYIVVTIFAFLFSEQLIRYQPLNGQYDYISQCLEWLLSGSSVCTKSRLIETTECALQLQSSNFRRVKKISTLWQDKFFYNIMLLVTSRQLNKWPVLIRKNKLEPILCFFHKPVDTIIEFLKLCHSIYLNKLSQNKIANKHLRN